MPTHQMAQTMTGAMFFRGLCTPNRPAATIPRNSATPSVRHASRNIGATSRRPTALRVTSKRQYSSDPGALRMNAASIANDTATVSPAPARYSESGIGRS